MRSASIVIAPSTCWRAVVSSPKRRRSRRYAGRERASRGRRCSIHREATSVPGVRTKEQRRTRQRARVLAAALELGPGRTIVEIAAAAGVSVKFASAELASLGARAKRERVRPRRVSLWKAVATLERRLLAEGLDLCRGNAMAAARYLQMDRATMLQKIDRCGLTTSMVSQRFATRGQPRVVVPPRARSFWAEVEDHERALLIEALVQTQGNTTQAAIWLRADRVTMIRKVARYGLRHLQARSRGRVAAPLALDLPRIAAALRRCQTTRRGRRLAVDSGSSRGARSNRRRDVRSRATAPARS